MAQPGPLHQNLNEIQDENNIMADIIVIDSTSDLSKINKLKKKSSLGLSFTQLREIPKEFVQFRNTKHLTLRFYNTGITDLSFLNEFPNLTYLRIDRYEGTVLSLQDLHLDSLTFFYIGYCPRLADIGAMKKLSQLQELFINNVSTLKEFPRFTHPHSLRKLVLDHMSNGRFFNDKNPIHYPTAIRNIQYLTHLEELTLGSLTFLHEVPAYLPKSLQKLEITGWALHHWEGDRVEIRNLDNLRLYPKLKEVILYNIHLKEFKGNFNNVSLDFLRLWYIPNLKNISGIFDLKSVKEIKIQNCDSLVTVSGYNCNNTIGTLYISECARVANIDFLFNCTNLNEMIVFSSTNQIRLSKSVNLDRIPNISVNNSNNKLWLYKKNNEWQIHKIEDQ